MGYRSEVVLVVGKELMPFFLHKISGCNPAQVMCFQDADHMENDYDNEGATLFHWNQIKWYESWPEVATVQSFITDCDCGAIPESLDTTDDPGLHFRFIRIGEDQEDFEDVGSGFHDVFISRAINF